MGERRWRLTLGAPFAVSPNNVAPAVDAAGRDVVLKLGVPGVEIASEISALPACNGGGAVALLDFDQDR